MPDPGAAHAPPPPGSASPAITGELPTTLPDPLIAYGTLRPAALAPYVPYWPDPSCSAIVSAPGNGKSWASFAGAATAGVLLRASAAANAASAVRDLLTPARTGHAPGKLRVRAGGRRIRS